MEDEAVEGDDAAGGDDDGVAGIAAGVADEVVSALFLRVIDDTATRSTATLSKEVDGGFILPDHIERAPAGDIGFVAGAGVVPFDVAAVLVPGKLHALFGAFDDPLLVEEIGL